MRCAFGVSLKITSWEIFCGILSIALEWNLFLYVVALLQSYYGRNGKWVVGFVLIEQTNKSTYIHKFFGLFRMLTKLPGTSLCKVLYKVEWWSSFWALGFGKCYFGKISRLLRNKLPQLQAYTRLDISKDLNRINKTVARKNLPKTFSSRSTMQTVIKFLVLMVQPEILGLI